MSDFKMKIVQFVTFVTGRKKIYLVHCCSHTVARLQVSCSSMIGWFSFLYAERLHQHLLQTDMNHSKNRERKSSDTFASHVLHMSASVTRLESVETEKL